MKTILAGVAACTAVVALNVHIQMDVMSIAIAGVVALAAIVAVCMLWTVRK